jgi:hypothetical protein
VWVLQDYIDFSTSRDVVPKIQSGLYLDASGQLWYAAGDPRWNRPSMIQSGDFHPGVVDEAIAGMGRIIADLGG